MAAPTRLPADQAAEVLQVVLQQLPKSWDIRTFCSLMQVSTAFRSAVLTAGVSCTVTAIPQLCTADTQQFNMAKFVSFCAWLPGHASLVSGIDLANMPKDIAAEQLLACTLQLCTQQAPATAAAGTTLPPAPATQTGLVRPLQQLQLTTFTAACMPPLAALEALSCMSTLMELKIKGLSVDEPTTADCRSLSKLTGMRRLDLCQTGRFEMFPAHLGDAFSGLCGLQKLVCKGAVQLHTLRQLPSQLRSLEANVSRITVQPAAASECLDLSRLTQLTRLFASGRIGGLVVPGSVIRMALGGNDRVSAWPALTLPHMAFYLCAFNTLEVLGPQLAAMPALQTLVVECRLMQQIPLSVSTVLSSALAAATQLTCLRLVRFDGLRNTRKPLVWDDPVLLCGSLRQLPGLSELEVSGFKLQPADVLQWTALSGLTSLKMRHCSSMGDTAAAALACKLTGLRKLELRGCGLESPVLWPAFAACSGLQSLCLARNELSVSFDTLMLLTSLTQLTHLDLLGLRSDVTHGGGYKFLQALPGLQLYCQLITAEGPAGP